MKLCGGARGISACKYLPWAVRLKYRCMEANFSESETYPIADWVRKSWPTGPRGFFDPDSFPVPDELLGTIRGNGYLVWCYLARWAERRTGEGEVLIEALAEGINVHPHTAKIHLHKMAETGHITLGTPRKALLEFSDGSQRWRTLIPYVVRAYADWPHDEETLKWWEKQKLRNQKPKKSKKSKG